MSLTTTLILNIVLAAVAVTAIYGLIAWAIKAGRRDPQRLDWRSAAPASATRLRTATENYSSTAVAQTRSRGIAA